MNAYRRNPDGPESQAATRDNGRAASPHRPEVHEFAERIFEKCNRRQRKRGDYDDRWPDAVRDMVRDLLTKEGWRRDPAAPVGNPTP